MVFLHELRAWGCLRPSRSFGDPKLFHPPCASHFKRPKTYGQAAPCIRVSRSWDLREKHLKSALFSLRTCTAPSLHPSQTLKIARRSSVRAKQKNFRFGHCCHAQQCRQGPETPTPARPAPGEQAAPSSLPDAVRASGHPPPNSREMPIDKSSSWADDGSASKWRGHHHAPGSAHHSRSIRCLRGSSRTRAPGQGRCV